jgi:hypothetical protein
METSIEEERSARFDAFVRARIADACRSAQFDQVLLAVDEIVWKWSQKEISREKAGESIAAEIFAIIFPSGATGEGFGSGEALHGIDPAKTP